MSLFAVKNDEGGWLDYDGPIRADWNTSNGTLWAKQNKHYAEVSAKRMRGHVVELVEKPALIVVSEDEAEILKKAKNTTVWRPASVISKYAYNAAKDSDQEVLLEDRLMRAYVIGWTVAKPKRWNVKAPHTKEVWYYKSSDGDLLTICLADKNFRGVFTEKEISDFGLQDCERVEVTDDEQ